MPGSARVSLEVTSEPSIRTSADVTILASRGLAEVVSRSKESMREASKLAMHAILTVAGTRPGRNEITQRLWISIEIKSA